MANSNREEKKKRKAAVKATKLEKSRGKLESLFDTLGTEEGGKFNVSFEYFDDSQQYGASFKDWEETGLLSQTMSVFKSYCSSSLVSQLKTDKFHTIGGFPEADKTSFKQPTNVPLDANWAVLHLGGAEVLAGHIFGNTFFLVFFDTEHKFCLTKRVREN